MKREVVLGSVRIRITENGVQPSYLFHEDDSLVLIRAFAEGGSTFVRSPATRASLRIAGLMIPTPSPRGRHYMALTKAGQKRAATLFLDRINRHPPTRRAARRDRNRIINKNGSDERRGFGLRVY